MKKQIKIWGMMLVAAFALTNCTKENIQAPEVSEGTPFEIVASTVDTKTVNDGFSTDWVAGDQINIFHAITESTTYVSDGAFTITEDNLAASKFTGTLAGDFDPDEEYDWYAFYPYSSYIKTPANTNAGYMPVGSKSNEVQTQKGNSNMDHIAGANYPLAGFATVVTGTDKPEIKMSHVSSLLEINVTNMIDETLTVTEVVFNAPVEVVGTYYINFAGAITPESFTGSGDSYVSKSAILTVSEGAAIAKGESAKFYLAVKPFAATTGQKLSISVNGYSKEIELSKDVVFSPGKIKMLNFAYDNANIANETIVKFDFTSAAELQAMGISLPAAGSGTNISAAGVEKNGVLLTAAGGSTATRVWNSSGSYDLRAYKGATITLAAPHGCVISNVALAGATTSAITLSELPNSTAVLTVASDAATQKISSITVTYLGEVSENLPEIEVAEKLINTSAEGGVLTFACTLKNLEGQTLNCASDSEWLEATYADGNINVNVAANTGLAREGNITLTCGEAHAVILTVTQEAAENAVVPHLTVAEFAALSDGTAIYELTGTITGIYQAYNASYKNISFYLKDDSREEPIIIYRMSCDGIDYTKVTVGNVITVQGAKGSFNDAAQMAAGCVCANIVEATPAPVISYADNTVTITAVSGASIYYTLDGSAPSTSSTKYTAAFAISATATVQAIAVEANKPQSPAASQDCYYVDPNAGDDAQIPSNTACYILTTASYQGSNNSYASNCDVSCNGITWNITGNAKVGDNAPWRIGGKSLDGVDRYVYTKTPYSAALSKIEFISGSVTITWNSLELQYSTNSSFSDAKTIKATSVGADKVISFIPEGGFPANCYFRFVANVTNSSSSNKYIQLKEVRFYGYE